MTNFKNYTVVYGKTPDELASGVRELIEKGWQPIGGIAIEMLNNSKFSVNVTAEIRLYQAMVM